MSDEEPQTIRCRALLNWAGRKYGKEYDEPDNERTWFYIGTGLLEEVWDETDEWVPPDPVQVPQSFVDDLNAASPVDGAPFPMDPYLSGDDG